MKGYGAEWVQKVNNEIKINMIGEVRKTKIFYFCSGEMAERSNAAVLKTVVRATGPGVRIPLSPQSSGNDPLGSFFIG